MAEPALHESGTVRYHHGEQKKDDIESIKVALAQIRVCGYLSGFFLLCAVLQSFCGFTLHSFNSASGQGHKAEKEAEMVHC